MNLERIFNQKFKNNSWNSSESVSGTGSELEITKDLRISLQRFLKDFDIKSMLDAPCGDFNWMKEMDLEGIDYIGGDIVPDIINKNNELYDKKFINIDITTDDLPKCDLILVRDCLVHLSNNNIFKFFENLKGSDIKYLLTTSFPNKKVGEWRTNLSIQDGGWRPLNLIEPPFNLKDPIHIIDEKCKEEYPIYSDKSLVLYKVNDL